MGCTHQRTPKLTDIILSLFPTLQMATPPHSQDLLDNDMAHTARDSANYKVKLISSPFQRRRENKKEKKRSERDIVESMVD